MRFVYWKKRALLLLTIIVIALFVTSFIPGNCLSNPFNVSAEHRIGIFIYPDGEFAPDTGDIFRFIGYRVSTAADSGDELSLASAVPSFIRDTFSVDFIHRVPEPSTLLILGSGLIGLALFARKRFRK